MKKAFIEEGLCVACGTCLKACKLGAVSIPKGVHAVVDRTTCVGCGMCAQMCPASIIEVREVEDLAEEKVV